MLYTLQNLVNDYGREEVGYRDDSASHPMLQDPWKWGFIAHFLNCSEKVGGPCQPAQVQVPCHCGQQDRPVTALRDDRRRHSHQGPLG